MDIIAFLEGSAFCAGIAMGAASMMSIGRNNLTLVREGLARGRSGLVASLIVASYVVLLGSALMMGDRIATKGEVVRPVLSWFGLAALSWFAFLSLRAYVRASKTVTLRSAERESVPRCVRRVLLIVWCNPLTYIELLIVPAAISCSFMMPICRVLFIAGLISTKTLGCFGYSFGGVVLARHLRHESTMRMLDLGSGIVMSALAVLMFTGLMLRS